MSEKYKNIDDLFRDKFKDFELDPPEHVWENIKQNIQGSGGASSGNGFTKGGITGISIILIVAGIFTLYQLYYSNDNVLAEDISDITKVENLNIEADNNLLALKSESEQEIAISNTDFSNKTSKDKKNQKTRIQLKRETSIEKGKTSLVVADKLNQRVNFYSDNDQISSETKSDEILISSNIAVNDFLTPGDESELLAINDEIQYNIKETNNNTSDNSEQSKQFASAKDKEIKNPLNPEASSNPGIKSDYGKENDWLFGVYFTPEMIFHPIDDRLNTRSYSLDINAIYKFSGYFLQSGIGLAKSSDNGNYNIDYNKYLGSYEDVYNVTFDTTGGEVTPIYHTETVKVYDTINHVTITPTKRKYTYLQIPILFGYGNENKRVGWFVKGGPSLSILIDENIPDNNLSDARIINAESELPGRIKTNWQIIVSGGITYRLSNNLSFSLEPMVRYYLNSTYENSIMTTKHPYSFGLRTGFLLNF